MQKILILAAGLALVATSAYSQTSSRDRDDYGREEWRESRGGWDQDDDRRRGRGHHDDDRSASGAHFFIRSGDAQLRVVCGGRESTQACVDAALRMFDRVQAQQGAAPRSPSSPPASGSSPAPQ
jgi:hypothetical protein